MKRKSRVKRVFSEQLKRKVVKDIEQGKVSIAAICREYSVSNVSVYKWLNKYSSFLQQGVKVVVELNSEAYRSKELEKRIKDIESALGRKQLEVEFLEKLIEIANQQLGIDIKKKCYTQPSTGLGSTGKKPGSK